LTLNGNIVDIKTYLTLPNLVDGLNREDLAALLEQLKGLEGRVMGRLLLGAPGTPEQSAVTRPFDDNDRMLTPDEASVVLRRSRQWIYRHSKTLPFVKRISRKSLLCSQAGMKRWLASRKA
jgi:hypothetical protein